MYTHISDMHDELNLPTLYQRRCQHIANQMHKLVHGVGPSYCIEMISRVGDTHDRQTRAVADDLLTVQQTRLKKTMTSIFKNPELETRSHLTLGRPKPMKLSKVKLKSSHSNDANWHFTATKTETVTITTH